MWFLKYAFVMIEDNTMGSSGERHVDDQQGRSVMR